MRSALVLALLLAGCGAQVSPDGSGSSNNQLGGVASEQDASTDSKPSASDAGAATEAIVEPTPSPVPTVRVDEIAYIEVDDKAAPVRIRLEANCRITDHKGLDSFALPKNCKETLDISVDTASYDCGHYGGSGTVTVKLKDGRAYVRDLSADRCSVVVPSLPTHKFMVAAWYSAGGRG